MLLPFKISKQFSQVLQGSIPSGFRQFTALATILAAEVFPAPLGPENKNDCGISFDRKILVKRSLTRNESRSETLCGRYFK